jgi:hypothetical protein
MPGHYELRGDTLFCEFEGVLTMGLLLECRHWIQALPKESLILKQVIDLSGVRSTTLKPDELNDFAGTRVLPPQTRRVVIAPQPLGYGLAREFQAYIDVRLGDDIQVFQSEEAALSWLNGA